MNIHPQQIDANGITHGDRVVGFADGDELKRQLDAGFLCGGWSKKRRAYAVLRPAKKRGLKPLVPTEADQEALRLLDRMHAIATEHGVTFRALSKRLHRLRRERV